jgi:hypothetical protein
MRIAHAILAGLQVINGASAILNIFGEKWAGLFGVLVAAAQAGLVVYDQGLQTEPPKPGA